MKRRGIVRIALILLVVGFFFLFYTNNKYTSEIKTKPLYGNINTLLNGYEQWKQIARKNGADRNLVLRLGYSKALSFKFTDAHGTANIDLTNGSMSVIITGLPETESFDLWLVDNKSAPKDSVKPEPWDKMFRVGSLKHIGKTATLEAHLDSEALKGFKIDLIVVAISSKGPGEAGLLFGSPSLFHRLYYSEQRGQVAKLGFDTSHTKNTGAQTGLSFPFNYLVPEPALAVGDETSSMATMLAEGEELFFEGTFNGNGRTCGTCHPMENNLTIDPEFIATLPPDDPLFVAEFNPKLKKGFEIPKLMREFGLIRENVDGFDDLDHKFVMRGVPHTLALITSINKAANTDFPGFGDGQIQEASLPDEMTGWSADGSPTGSLREFAIGAVTQHFTKTLARKAGKDFRLPNDNELNAMEAFQLSLGRQADPTLNVDNTGPGLKLKNTDAIDGKAIFILGGQNTVDNGDGIVELKGGKCSTCHVNGGASQLAGGVLRNRDADTGIEDFPNIPAKVFDPTIPRDGGFGRVNRSPRNCTTAPSTNCGFGDSRFNAAPLIEAADTPPFFHNNAINTIEEAVAFFNGPEFNHNPDNPDPRNAGKQINLSPSQITKVATLLRVLNALENIRSAIQLSDNASSATNFGRAKKSLRIAQAELEDAIQVLAEKNLHPNAVADLMDASGLTEEAIGTNDMEDRNELIDIIIDEAKAAREDICAPGSDSVLCPL